MLARWDTAPYATEMPLRFPEERSVSTAFSTGAKVRFAQQRLSTLAPRDRRGLAGRIGVVQTDGKLVKKPTVHFPADGARPELRLFRVDPAHLELVEKMKLDFPVVFKKKSKKAKTIEITLYGDDDIDTIVNNLI